MTTNYLIVVGEEVGVFFIIGGVPVIGAASSNKKLLFEAGQEVHLLFQRHLLL
jgi:hypothetical protein